MVFAPAVTQAPQLARWRPAQWVRWCALRRRAAAEWTFDCTAADFLKALDDYVAPSGLERLLVMYHPNAHMAQPKWGPFTRLSREGHKATLVWFSPTMQFLDVVEVAAVDSSDLDGTGRGDPGPESNHGRSCCVVRATACSAGLMPAWVLGVLLWSVLLCFVPFSDGGQNTQHLMVLRLRVETATKGRISMLHERITPSRGGGGGWALGLPQLRRRVQRATSWVPASVWFFLTYVITTAVFIVAAFVHFV